jgi:hypothetical protein
VIRFVMVVAFVPIVHNSGSHGEVQNLGLTPPNHAQTLGDKAGVIGQLPSGLPSSDGRPQRKARVPSRCPDDALSLQKSLRSLITWRGCGRLAFVNLE